MLSKKLLGALAVTAVSASALLIACGGGGGGSAPVLFSPYKTVYGDVCSTMEPTPGCTFLRSTGERVLVTADPDYNRTGQGSDSMEWVYFDTCTASSGYSGTCGYIHNGGSSLTKLILPISQFAGHVDGDYIGVGATGLHWVDVYGGKYWIGENGVLYNANSGETGYGRAINTKEAGQPIDTNLAAAASDAVEETITAAAEKLKDKYGFKPERAQTIASDLYNWAASAEERGYTTVSAMDKNFTGLFGVKFTRALAAVKEMRDSKGEKTDLMQAVTQDSADANGLRPDQAKRFMKDMYRQALASKGYNVDAYNW